ncbi:hypothetical protein ABT284_12450, partial [Nocardioides sp. NPDC000441]
EPIQPLRQPPVRVAQKLHGRGDQHQAYDGLDLGILVSVPVAELDLSREFRAVWIGGSRPPAGPVRDLLGIAGA